MMTPVFFLREIIFETEKNFDVRDPNARSRLMDEFFRWQIKTALDMGVEPENYTFSVLKEQKMTA